MIQRKTLCMRGGIYLLAIFAWGSVTIGPNTTCRVLHNDPLCQYCLLTLDTIALCCVVLDYCTVALHCVVIWTPLWPADHRSTHSSILSECVNMNGPFSTKYKTTDIDFAFKLGIFVLFCPINLLTLRIFYIVWQFSTKYDPSGLFRNYPGKRTVTLEWVFCFDWQIYASVGYLHHPGNSCKWNSLHY